MKTRLLSGAILFCLLMGLLPTKARAQEAISREAVKFDVSPPLREMVPASVPFWKKWFKENEPDREVPNKFRSTVSSMAIDPARQTVYNNGNKSAAVVPGVNFNGLNNSNNSGGRVTPPDPAGDIGPNHYVQVVNCMLQIFSRTGASLYGPVTTSTIWNGFSGNWNGHNDGDAIVMYDENADRWIVTQFAVDCTGSPYTEYELVAVSTTPDPTGSYYRYAFQFDYMPDYPKLGIWHDGYYLAANRFNTNTSGSFVGVAASVLERPKMLTGDASARMVYFKTETLGGSGSASGSSCFSMLPSDCDGTFPAATTPNYFTYVSSSGELRIWAFHTDWTTTSNCSFTYTTALPITAYSSLSSVAQSGTTNTLDGLGDRLMYRNQCRSFGSYESYVTCHNVSSGGVGCIRWYEYRRTGGVFSLYQQSTYNPGDGKSRWMGSIAMNSSGDIGLAYSVSSSSTFPSIYFTGRKASDPVNQMTIAESLIQTGTVSMTGATRWGDYTNTNVDPVDNQTFWTTQEYVGTFGGTWPWATKIASFKFAITPSVVTLAAAPVSNSTATLNGTINPNGFASTYYFEYGTTTSYGSTTTSTAAGSGSTAVSVNAPISSLVSGTLYHFRLVGVNSEGTAYGNDMTFTPGGASLTTTAASSLTLTTAVSGGNVISDGGSAITARGVCWATTANPTVTGNHTSDGSGLGIFASNITGLSASTLYHVRAYATNSNGTWYGDDLTFTTLCGVYNSLPFNEPFTNTTIPTCWVNQDNQGNGQVWQFGTMTAYGTNNPVLTGNYAYLNSDGYGSGNSQNADLITPTLDLTSYATVNLQFKHYFRSYSGSSAKLMYSINNGSTWTTLNTYTTSTANPATYNQAIPAVAGQSQVKFKWNYTGTYGYYWAIDDVSITGTLAVSLAVTPSNQNVAATAGSTSFNVTTPATWSAVSDAAWCTVTASGTGNGALAANYTQNTGASSRVANITVSAPGAVSVVVTVTQSGTSPTLTVTPSNQNVTAVAGSTSFTVTSNSAWSVVSNSAWCTVTPSGNGNGTIIANYLDNTLPASRVANITVTVAGLPAVVVTVTQAGGSLSLAVTPPNQNVPSTAGNTSFTVTSNTSWSAVSNAAWCTVTPSGSGNGTITATYQANALTTSRVANITVSASGVPSVVVTVTQTGTSPTLTVTPSNQNVPYTAGNTSFTVTSNSAWTVSSNASWCTPTASGSGNGSITATYTENPLITPRIATLTVSVAGLPSVNVTVTQAAAPIILLVTPDNITVNAVAGTATYNVTCNTSWTATCNNFWSSVTSSGSGNGSLVVTYSQNLTPQTRISYIAVTPSNGVPVNVTLTQLGTPPYLTVEPHSYSVTPPAGSVNFSVSSNLDWTVSSDAAWCTPNPLSGSLNGVVSAAYTENVLALPRTAHLTFNAPGMSPVVVSVEQSGPAASLAVTPPSLTVANVAGVAHFSVASNTSWNASCNSLWCQTSSSGTGNGIVDVDYQINLTGLMRNVVIFVSGTGAPTASAQLIQLPSFDQLGEGVTSGIEVFPNPTNGIFMIGSSSGELQDLDVTIYSADGRLIVQKAESGKAVYNYDLNREGKGTYLVVVKKGDKKLTFKLLVQ